MTEKYNPDFGDDKLCHCGHPYYRHFDTYEDMLHVGCKYCPCDSYELNKPKTGFDKYLDGKLKDPEFAKGYTEAMKELTIPSWSNTLNYKFKFWGHISNFYTKIVAPSGYPFFLWNDRVYKVVADGWEITDLLVADLDNGTQS